MVVVKGTKGLKWRRQKHVDFRNKEKNSTERTATEKYPARVLSLGTLLATRLRVATDSHLVHFECSVAVSSLGVHLDNRGKKEAEK